jgi:hypothetical protein
MSEYDDNNSHSPSILFDLRQELNRRNQNDQLFFINHLTELTDDSENWQRLGSKQKQLLVKNLEEEVLMLQTLQTLLQSSCMTLIEMEAQYEKAALNQKKWISSRKVNSFRTNIFKSKRSKSLDRNKEALSRGKYQGESETSGERFQQFFHFEYLTRSFSEIDSCIEIITPSEWKSRNGKVNQKTTLVIDLLNAKW